MIPVNNHQHRPLPPAKTSDMGAAYGRLALGVAHYFPNLINNYWGPRAWRQTVAANPPTLDRLRTQAVALATAVQQSPLPENRQKRVLRRVRALLWLVRCLNQEPIIFSEQVRLLLDVQPESVDEAFFQTAHETLTAVLPGNGTLAERWAAWQRAYSIPTAKAAALLPPVLAALAACWQEDSQQRIDPMAVIPEEGVKETTCQAGVLKLPAMGTVRVDRLYHLAARWGAGGVHSLQTAAAQRFENGDLEEALWLNLGPDQVLAQGLPVAWLPALNLYQKAIPHLLESAGFTAMPPAELQAIHMAEDALQWALGNAALLLHGERLRPRAVRRHLIANALYDRQTADTCLARLSHPVQAAQGFAALIGGPLLAAWLAQDGNSLNDLMIDPPVPSTMVFAVRFAH